MGKLKLDKLEPYGDTLLVKELVNKKEDSGFAIPSSIDVENIIYAEVIAVGDDYINENGIAIPIEVFVGEKIIFHKLAGLVVDQMEKVFAINVDKIIAVERG